MKNLSNRMKICLISYEKHVLSLDICLSWFGCGELKQEWLLSKKKKNLSQDTLLPINQPTHHVQVTVHS